MPLVAIQRHDVSRNRSRVRKCSCFGISNEASFTLNCFVSSTGKPQQTKQAGQAWRPVCQAKWSPSCAWSLFERPLEHPGAQVVPRDVQKRSKSVQVEPKRCPRDSKLRPRCAQEASLGAQEAPSGGQEFLGLLALWLFKVLQWLSRHVRCAAM